MNNKDNIITHILYFYRTVYSLDNEAAPCGMHHASFKIN